MSITHLPFLTLFLLLIPLSTSYDPNLWAIVISTSDKFENYRHSVNALLMYQTLRSNGIPDERIILALSQYHGCDSRNIYPGEIKLSDNNRILSGSCQADMSIDYKEQDNHNYQVLDILRGRQMNLMNSFRQLNSDKNSRIVVIITSHGGENFIKVREKLVILSDELHRTLNEMYIKDKYKEMLFILDTCEGFSLFDNVKVPNVYFVASALLDQKASSYSFDTNIMGPTADKFHYLLWKELNRINKEKAFDMLVSDLMKDLAKQKEFLTTDVTIRNEIQRNLTIGEFFGDTRWGDHVMEEVLQFVNVDEFDKANEVKNTLGVNSVLLESKREKEVEVLNVRKYTRDVYEMERKENGMGRRITAGMFVGGIAMVVVGSLVL